MTIDNGDGRWRDDERAGGDPDDVLRDFEDDDAEDLQSREDEASDIALAVPGGIIFDEEPDDGGFDAEHNP